MYVCVSLNLPILYFVDYLGLRKKYVQSVLVGCNRNAYKVVTGLRINKELSAGLNGSVSVSGHCHDRRVKGFDSPFSSKYI